jgi:hypothetical protein
MGGGLVRGGSVANTSRVVAASAATPATKLGCASCFRVVSALTFRKNWMHASSISFSVAGGSKPRNGVMFLHIWTTYIAAQRPALLRINYVSHLMN